jgi:predicted dehydrogenase
VVTEYASGATGVFQAGHESSAAPDAWEAWFEIVGGDGELQATLGAMIGEPGSTPDRLEVRSRDDRAGDVRDLPGAWFPDAFAGPMAAVMRSIVEGGEPPTSAADALRSLELVRAAELSHESGQPVELPLT